MYIKGIAVRKKYKSEWRAWQNAKARCYHKKCPLYKWYGARGIKMCSKWKHNFMAFLGDVGEKPSKDLTLDRIHNNLGYQTGNCRWVSRKVQANNRRYRTTGYGRKSSLITVRNMTKTIREWSILLGYKNNSLYCFKRNHNLSYEQAIELLYYKL